MGNHSNCEFMSPMALSRQEDTHVCKSVKGFVLSCSQKCFLFCLWVLSASSHVIKLVLHSYLLPFRPSGYMQEDVPHSVF